MSEKEEAVKKAVQTKEPTFCSMVEGMKKNELEKELSRLSNYREQVQFAKGDDEDLERASKIVKELAGPYNDALKVLKLKTAYLHLLLKDKTVGEEEI